MKILMRRVSWILDMSLAVGIDENIAVAAN